MEMTEALFGISDCTLENVSEETDKKTGRRYRKIAFKYNGEKPSICPKCGGKMYGHGSRIIKIVDVPQEIPVRWEVDVPRSQCTECNAMWRPIIGGIDETRNMSSRAFVDITQRSLRDAFQYVGDDYMLSANTVKNMFVDFLKVNEQMLKFKTPAFIGIDEIKVKKLGELTVITDLEHRTLFDILQGRNQITLTEYFMNLKGREDVLWVCSDMYRPFQKTIGSAMPNAKWAIDHFHVVMKANEAVDAVRRTMQDSMTKKDRIKTKRGLAYTLKTRAKDLDVEEASKIRAARVNEKLKPLATAYDLKEDFFNIYDDNKESKENAQKAFAEWEKSIPKDEIYDKFRELAGTVHNFYEQIFAAWDCPIAISNGFTECTNRIIRENNTRGRGYSFDVLRGRTLYRKSNLTSIITSGMAKLGPPIPEEGPTFHFEGSNEDDEDSDEDEYEPFPAVDPDTGEPFT